ncbi:TetR/AcrR family transcriptional regulator [Virgibacillus kekensis]|uniref:TetR/AcrR family transcriptional regulator n=1 Tax=Virgibacillus kekensis TaxID=202261 RepID=A0ABV9DIX6_9BACI
MAPRVSEQHLQQRRTDILAAASNVFMERGYEHTTMKHVMEAAGVSRGGLYQYFSNKEDLFEAILEEGLNDEAANTESLLTNTESHWELLMQLIYGENGTPDAKMDPLASSKLEFFITGRNDERRRAYGERRYKIGLRIYADVIKAGQKAREFSDRYDSELIARSIITFIDGLALDDAILPGDVVQVENQSKLLMDYLKMALDV